MEAQLRQAVRERAQNRCEYCRWPADYAQRPFTVDHIVPRKHGGRADLDNLAFCCFPCNARKGTNLSGIDPESGKVQRVFNPRRDHWDEHFHWIGARLHSNTPVGRATIAVLGINDPPAVAVRASLMKEGVY
ncbi:MAG: HNH endonuclease [Verrucomicrobiales bacterium]|nr:HNH endonuclease [Verrucomicrobiales bacterium]